jgi:hypothetical protein
MSDSLKETVIVIVPASTISAKTDELLLEDDDEAVVEAVPLPTPPAAPDAPAPAPEEPEPEPELAALAEPVDPADTESPVLRLARDTIVPVAGA